MRVALIALLLVVAPAVRAEEKPPPKDAPGRAEVGEAPTSFTRAQVGAAVKGGVAYLRRTQGDHGGWGPIGKDRWPVQMYRHPAGPTALALYALRTCGVPRRGTTKEITMTAHAVEEGDRYRITGSEELNMTEFGVKPPELMLGTLKVHDKVVVRYEIILTVPRPVASR